MSGAATQSTQDRSPSFEPTDLECRALILAPSGRDGSVAQALLRQAGLVGEVCPDLDALLAEYDRGTGTVVATEEALIRADLRGLSTRLGTQPSWSDLPIVVLTSRAPGGLERNPAAMRLTNVLGNIVFLERPFHPMTFVSVVKTALRARRRQYEARARLLEIERSAEAVREGEARLRLALTAGHLGSWDLDMVSGVLSCSDTCKSQYGRASMAFTYQDLIDSVHPEDRARRARDVDLAVRSRSSLDTEYRNIWPDGSIHWVAVRGRTTYAADGTPLRMTGVSLDITAQKREEGRRKLLLDELNHRVKNTLATVQSIVAQTLHTSASPESFRAALEARLLALSQTHNLLTRGNWGGADLKDILRAELSPFGDEIAGSDIGRFVLRGPPVRLSPKAAVAMGMAFHELATNAAKYGALARPEGLVSVAWQVERDGGRRRLRLEWVETCGPMLTGPPRRGFGSRLIQQGLAGELDGDVRLEFPPEGARCRIDIPLVPENVE